MTQKEAVIQYVKDFGSISSMEAFKDLGITRLAARIFDIERDTSFRFDRKDETSKNRYGRPVTFKRYSLKEEGDEQ